MKKRFFAVTGVALLSISMLSGCAFFDRDARDKAACDEISSILTAAGESSIPGAPSPDLIAAIERRALPLASARFGQDIKNLVDSFKVTSSDSIFDTFAGLGDGLYLTGLVLERCYQLSSRVS
jgi:hypothetical protein